MRYVKCAGRKKDVCAIVFKDQEELDFFVDDETTGASILDKEKFPGAAEEYEELLQLVKDLAHTTTLSFPDGETEKVVCAFLSPAELMEIMDFSNLIANNFVEKVMTQNASLSDLAIVYMTATKESMGLLSTFLAKLNEMADETLDFSIKRKIQSLNNDFAYKTEEILGKINNASDVPTLIEDEDVSELYSAEPDGYLS